MAVGFVKKNKEINKVVLLPLEQVRKSPNQPRKYFDPQAINELARSIAANGLLQPVTVRKTDNGVYELIAGERRLLAYHSLGRENIPAIIEELSDEQSAVLSLIENLQRKDLNFFEEAHGIEKLMHELGLNQQQISQKLGRAQSTVANKLRLLKYSPEIQQKMLDANLTERHARAMLKISDEDRQSEIIDMVIEKNLNVEQTEQYIEKLTTQNPAKIGTRLFIIKDMRVFMNSIHKAIATMNRAGIPVQSVKSETDEFVEVSIRIPKALVYRNSRCEEKELSLSTASY